MIEARVVTRPDRFVYLEGVSVVIPTLNEAPNIGWVLSRLPAFVDQVVLVDGRSTDGTVETALAVRPDALLVEETIPGKGAALRAGFEASTGRYIVILDADGSMNPAEIGRFVALLEEGYDLVKGSRFVLGGGSTDLTRIRQLGNRGLIDAVNLLYGTRFTDLCYGFLAFHRTHLPALSLAADGFEIEAEILANAVNLGFRIAEVPSIEAPRRSGASNLRTFRDGSRVLRTILKQRFDAEMRRRRVPALAPLIAAEEAELPAAAIPIASDVEGGF